MLFLLAGSYGLTVPRLQHQIKSGIALRRAASAESDLAFTDWKKGSSSAILLGGAPRRRTVAGADIDYIAGPVPAAGDIGAVLRGQQQSQQPVAYGMTPPQQQQQQAGHAEPFRHIPHPAAAVAAAGVAVDVPWLQSLQQQQQRLPAAQPVAVSSSSQKEYLLGDASSQVLSAPVSTRELSHMAESPEPLDGRGQTRLMDTVPGAAALESRQQQHEQWQVELLGSEPAYGQRQQQVGHEATPFSQPGPDSLQQQHQQQQGQQLHRLSNPATAAGATSTQQVLASDAAAENTTSRLLRRPPSAPGQPSAAAWMADEEELNLGLSYPASVSIGSPVKRRPASPFEQQSGKCSSADSPSFANASIGQSASRECLAGEGHAAAANAEPAENVEEQESFLAVTWDVFKGRHIKYQG